MADEAMQHVKLVRYHPDMVQRLVGKLVSEIHQIITNSCLTYAAYDSFEEGASYSEDALDEQIEKRPFYKYSAQYWGHHF